MNKFRLSSDSLFSRPKEDKRINPARIIFLSVEGNKSEQDYFKWLQKNRTRCGIDSLIHVHALPKMGSVKAECVLYLLKP